MKLLLLRCPECAHPLAPQQHDVVMMCPSCQTAVAIDEQGLSSMPIQYVAATEADVSDWLPFWFFNGRVHIQNRSTQSSWRTSDHDSETFWLHSDRFFVPAWELAIHNARELGRQLVKKQPTYQPVSRPDNARLTAVTVTAEDALKMLEFIILTIEAERKDWLKDLKFRIEAETPQLWALPARKKSELRWMLLAAEA